MTDDASVAVAARDGRAAGGLNVLISNTGITGDHVPVPETGPEHLLPVLETNLLGSCASRGRSCRCWALGQPRDRRRVQRDGLSG